MQEEQQVNKKENISFFAKLLDRSVFKITGPDALTFLQGQFTNDVMPLSGDTHCIYGAFLTPQGKLITDAFLVKCPSDDAAISVLVDVHTTSLPLMVEQFKKMKLRSKFEVITQDDMCVFVSMDSAFTQQQPCSVDEKPHVVVQDPRDNQMGFRIYATLINSDLNHDNKVNDANLEKYYYKLADRVIPYTEAILTPQRSFIMEYGFEKINGVSFTKGCYVGQELTSRMYHRQLDKRFLVCVHTKLDEASANDIKESVVGMRILLDGIDMGVVKAYNPPNFLCHLNKKEMLRKFSADMWCTSEDTFMVTAHVPDLLAFHSEDSSHTFEIETPIITFVTRADLYRFEKSLTANDSFISIKSFAN